MAGKKLPIIISHFTKNTPYEKEVVNLHKSLVKFNLEHHIQAINSLGSWRANSNWCITQIKNMLEKYPTRDILRVDCDAVIQKYPSLFTSRKFKADVAAVIWENSKMCPGGELLGGTMFFANNKGTRELVNAWALQNKKTPLKRNGDMLFDLLKNQYKDIVQFEKLPLSYCCIFDLMKKEVGEPVIEHFQASRRFKSTVNKKG
jgi:hypothetical protein